MSKQQRKSKPPVGMKLVVSGKVQLDDWAFASATKKWKPLQSTEVGNPISDYHAVARKEKL